jgi:hypothetical protein
MSEELAIEVIRLRHRLRTMVAFPGYNDNHEATVALERFRRICESLQDVDLLSEHARWRTHFEQLGV